jgi:hypothetical protein
MRSNLTWHIRRKALTQKILHSQAVPLVDGFGFVHKAPVRLNEARTFVNHQTPVSQNTKKRSFAAGACFLREVPERAIGGVFAVLRLPKPDRTAGKWGVRGKRGRQRCFGGGVEEVG